MNPVLILVAVLAFAFGAMCAAHSIQLHRRGSPLNTYELAAYLFLSVALTITVFGHR